MSKPTTHAPLEDQHARAPIDRVAARVTAKGERWYPLKRVNQPMMIAPLPTRPLPPDVEDLTGRRIGRLRVVGMTLAVNTKQSAKWLMRCDCGMYVLRTGKAVRNPENDKDACEHCRALLHLKRAELFRRTQRYE